MANSKCVKMADGREIPALGFGTWLAAPGVVGQSVKLALESGYKHIDCAHVYQNEAEIGEYLTETWDSGKVKREDVFITSKLWVQDMRPERVEEACRLTLKNLQVSYLDLYLTHQPFELDRELKTYIPFTPEDQKYVIGYDADRFFETWTAMEKLVEKGLVRSIGVSNMTCQKLKNLLDRKPKIIPACNQVEHHPFLPQKKLRGFCMATGIALVSYSSLGNSGRPAVIIEEGSPVVLQNEIVTDIAAKKAATPAQVLIAWGISQGFSVLAKSTNEGRIKENLAGVDLALDGEDIKRINSIATRLRILLQTWALKPGQNADDLWDGEIL